MQKVAVTQVGGGRPFALGEGRNHLHEDHVTDRGFHSLHDNNLVHTPVPISEATKMKTSYCKKIGKKTQLGMSFFLSNKATNSSYLICTCRRFERMDEKPEPLIDQVDSGCTRQESTTKKNPENNYQEDILRYDEDLRICPLEDSDRVKFGSTKCA